MAGRPLITANQVTLARLIPMPLLSWLIYRGAHESVQGNPYLWAALIAGTLIGCTDWVDGVLARKYGPTVLGGLLDPIADKVFIAFAYIPFADNQVALVPWWAVALMFMREFFITALRSAYEQRNLTLKTSYLAKVKTWTQMQGIGVMLLFPLVENPRKLTWGLAVLTFTPLVVLAAFWLIKKKFWKGALVMSGSVAPILALHLYGDPVLTMPLDHARHRRDHLDQRHRLHRRRVEAAARPRRLREGRCGAADRRARAAGPVVRACSSRRRCRRRRGRSSRSWRSSSRSAASTT